MFYITEILYCKSNGEIYQSGFLWIKTQCKFRVKQTILMQNIRFWRRDSSKLPQKWLLYIYIFKRLIHWTYKFDEVCITVKTVKRNRYKLLFGGKAFKKLASLLLTYCTVQNSELYIYFWITHQFIRNKSICWYLTDLVLPELFYKHLCHRLIH